MNVKEVFDNATSENKSLTYEQFEEIVKANKAKFTDLAEGNYVSKQKYEDDLQTKETQISTLNESLNTRDTDLEAIKGQLAEAQTELQNAGANASKLEELNAQLADMKSKYDTETANLNNKLSAQAYEFAVRDFAGKQKFSSEAAKRDFTASMIQKGLPMENGSIMGATDYLKEYSKVNKDAFVQENKGGEGSTPPPQFSASTSGNGNSGGTKMSLSEMMKLKNENPNAVISFE